MNVIFELPFYSPVVGGIVETIKIAERVGATIRFQRRSDYTPKVNVPYTIGLPDKTFPTCDVVISYSDNPFTDRLVALPQIGRVMVYMMSWGMSLTNERHNALHPDVTALCTTKKIEDAIVAEGGKVYRVGFALDMNDMVDLGNERHDTLALYYHPMESKRYKLGVEVSNALYGMKFIDNVLTFGTSEGYSYHKKPAGLVKHYQNASRTDVLNVFNASKMFIMPSVSEGLNLTPIEATLCGCPSIIVDGAIDEIFIDGETCFIADSEFTSLCDNARELYAEIGTYRPIFKDNMREIVNQYTWDKLIKNFKDVL